MSVESLDNRLLAVNYELGVIYQAFQYTPLIPRLEPAPDLKTKVQPHEVIDFFKRYTAKLARRKLEFPTEQPSSKEEGQSQSYRTLVLALENHFLYPHFYPTVRKQDSVNTNLEKLHHFKEDFNVLGQSLDVICVMTGAFVDSVITSEYLKYLGNDANLILLYHSTKSHKEDEFQVFDSEKERMRRIVPALIIEDVVQSGTTVERVANYLLGEGYDQIFIFSPQVLKISSGNLEIVKSEPNFELLKDVDNYVLAQLLRFRPQS